MSITCYAGAVSEAMGAVRDGCECSGGLVRFGVAVNGKVLSDFDRAIQEQGYANRSEAIRDLIRAHLVEREWDGGDQEVVGTITLVYDHHGRGLGEHLTDIQHDHQALVISTLHVHLDHDNCLEVLVVRGRSAVIRRLADSLISVKGVKHGRLTMTSTGRGLR